MKAIFRYDAGPRLAARFAALGGEGFVITPCPEDNDRLFVRLLPDAEVLLHILKLTKVHIHVSLKRIQRPKRRTLKLTRLVTRRDANSWCLWQYVLISVIRLLNA